MGLGHLDDGRDAAGRRPGAPGGEPLEQLRVGLLEVGVGVDAAWQHPEPGASIRSSACSDVPSVVMPGDPPIDDEHVGTKLPISR